MRWPFVSSRSLLLFVWLLLSAGLIADWQRWVPSALIEKAKQEYGNAAASRIEGWQQMMRQASGKEETEQLRLINDFFNQNIRFVNDDQHWGEVDYWATPYEALGSNGADCEDYVIAKYYSLRQLGVDTQKLRITYVKALRYNQAHMVLSYFPTPDAVPFVLDNLIASIRPASQRRDLSPVYSFNAEGMWLERLKGEGIRMGNPNKLDLWTNLRIRMNELGLDL
ncbi:transglutaminase-like cysteine peptidase [Bacterioplanoides sp. SCSIO 12839]|uniref:transglutaminase-like cysteine peptidase n=1 Tax=Bacterioplanoides sp. SCSIO 12839 TaxID=2829569 RepID=UPI00210575D1|nr:transglutaminase-like cysteine peptidase [Bacterioplanoides sp. SCSIO 12839]UTW47755.1 transglutaminase-like cysteine peptidase [Bacterioplanoides sp. SCSIO 12839]